MAWYYVKGGGTAGSNSDAGREAVAPRTGVWTGTTGAYYGTIAEALTALTVPTSGDIICWSDESVDSTGDVVDTLPDGVCLLTVDNDNVDQIAVAPSYQIDNAQGDHYYFLSAVNSVKPSLFYGINIKTGQSSNVNQNGFHQFYRNTRFEFNHSTALFTYGGKLSHTTLYHTDIIFRSTSSSRMVMKGVCAEYHGCTFSYGSATTIAVQITKDGANLMFRGCDFSSLPDSQALVQLLASPVDESSYVVFEGCTLPVAWSVTNLETTSKNGVVIIACDSPYQYLCECRQGTIDFVTNVSYDAHDTLDDGSSRGSYEFETNANTSTLDPLYLSANHKRIVLAATNTEAATKKKVRIRFCTASGDTLDEDDVTFIVTAPNASTTYHPEFLEHWDAGLNAGDPLLEETGRWTGPNLGTQYYLDIDLGSPGNGQVTVMPGVCKPDVTVYFSWQLEFVA